jgi:hypothetical protein
MDEGEETSNYKAPKKVDLSELAKKDEGDESLERYKKQLLGQALDGKDSKINNHLTDRNR